ncbi:hypothetical protein BP6252_10459 [Coleophoma cylindrospora]|uniref:Ino eighty subunit 1 n=1 Tax=Coleophoma cylindrospora TaxID=1849047 RepID=A0A3D8QT05_9HELO|nr:hypothetical protein BP6252_10459 [Coleophoma cylindrospora]
MTDLLSAPSPGSTIAASEMGSPARVEPRSTVHHLLDNPDSARNTPAASNKYVTDMMTEDDDVRTPGGSVAPDPPASVPAATSSRKRKAESSANGATSTSMYSGNKVKHLKKDDGEPLWRKDIQYDFLKLIFEDTTACFTNSYDPDTIGKQTFANVYIDAMARSSKTSKILRDKLLTEHEPAKNMAMVCLLVNLGRMNTTLNFFPEMRAQLRTYHAIPSLQAHQDPNSYKQLQDAPRLKSILKGASEDRPEPNTLEKIKSMTVPRTNPVNLIFVLAQFAPKVTELHFPPPRDFYDLIMRTTISSASRARAFLWLMWFYLESDFTEEGAEENPFGAGVDYGVDLRNQGVPRFDYMLDEQADQENIDTPEEIEYGHAKMRERKRIIEADQAAFQAENGPPKRGPKPKLYLPPDDGGPSPAATIIPRMRSSKYESDMDSTRSTPPPRASFGGARIGGLISGRPLNGNGGSLPKRLMDGSSPVPYVVEGNPRRARPLTAHQLAVERNRNQRVDYILSRGLRKVHHRARKHRRQDGAVFRALHRTKHIPLSEHFDDSEDDESIVKDPGMFRERGFRGIVQLTSEDDDFGEESSAYAAAMRRMGRRLDRWDGQKDLNLGVMGTNRVPQGPLKGEANGHSARDNDETEDERPTAKVGKRAPGNDVVMEDDEDLDDMEKEILGIGNEGYDEDSAIEEDNLDDVDKQLLGINDATDSETYVGGEDE